MFVCLEKTIEEVERKRGTSKARGWRMKKPLSAVRRGEARRRKKDALLAARKMDY